ncbi:MAG: hypothetical protein SGARI_000289 [Bacillariaceae sp.]
MREYEREILPESDVDLGLTLGWRFQERTPMQVDEVSTGYRDIEPISEGERVNILLDSGYSKRQLRSAIRERHRRMNSDDGVKMPKSVASTPTLVLKKVARGVKFFFA